MMHNDRFVEDENGTRAGIHIIADIWGASHLDDVSYVREALRDAAVATGATILNDDFHSFGEGEGCTGIIVLAESHISIHTWPERGYAAVDVFTCGVCNPHAAIPVIKEKLQAENVMMQELIRGMVM